MTDLDASIGLTRPDEVEAILEVTAQAGVFDEKEVGTVRELLDGYYDDPDKSGYNFLSYREEGRVLGYACWGPRDLAGHGYDFYWLCTALEARSKGIGQALMQRVEAEVLARNGIWIVIETSDTDHYASARRLYERCGYQKSMLLPDFYHEGDGLVTYTKRLR
ncbi:MAG TPA: GNAT family N-acetyltransferase [Anaerolineae bacterium]